MASDSHTLTREQLVDEVERLRQILREVEWVHDSEHGMAFCPVCVVAKPNHRSGCKLAVALDRKGE